LKDTIVGIDHYLSFNCDER